MVEPRLAGAASVEEANQVLWAYLPRFNDGFAVAAVEPDLAYRTLTPEGDLARICCFKYGRTVAADNTVRLGQHRHNFCRGECG